MATAPLIEREAAARAFFATPDRYLTGNYRIARRIELAREMLGSLRGKQLVDLGAGDGSIAAAIGESAHVTLVDSSASMLALAPAHHRKVHADLLSFDGAGRYDAALCIGVLAHVDDTARVVAALARSLRPGGQALLQFSDCERLLTKLAHAARAAGGGLRYRQTAGRMIRKLVEQHGLTIIDQRQHLLLLPAMRRLLGRALVPFDRFVSRHPDLARFGTDTLLLLSKA